MNMKIRNQVKPSVFTFLPVFFLLTLFIPYDTQASSKRTAVTSTKERTLKTNIKKRSRSKRRTIGCDSYSRNQLLSKANKYQTLITQAARDYKVSPYLITAVITVESCFRPKARSSSGAVGLMQLMPATARRFGTTNRYNNRHNIKAGTKYLKFLLNRFNGNVQLAAAAYNAGEGAVDKYNGVPPYRQTQAYVKKVLNAYRKLSASAPQQQITRKAPTHRKTREWYQAQYERNRLTRGLNLTTREIQHLDELLEIDQKSRATLSFKQFL